MAKKIFNSAILTPDELGKALLEEAGSSKPDLVKMKSLIAAGADVEVTGKDKKTPLLVAVSRQNVAAAELLIDNGADKYGKPEMAPMFLALALYDLDMVKMLLDKGVDPERDTYSAGMTALMWAANFGKKDIADEIARRGGDVNRKNETSGMTAPDYAENNLKPHIAESLRHIDAEKKQRAVQEEIDRKNRLERQRIAADKALLDAECDAGLPLQGAVKVMRPLSFNKPSPMKT